MADVTTNGQNLTALEASRNVASNNKGNIMQGNNNVQPMRRRQQRERPMTYTPTPDYRGWDCLFDGYDPVVDNRGQVPSRPARRHLTVACDCNTEPCFIRGYCESCDR